MGESKGDESPVHGRFGSARFLAFHDTATGETSVVADENEHHAHGGCQPLRVLGADSVDAVAVGGIGRHAVAALNGQGIRILRVIEGPVQQVS